MTDQFYAKAVKDLLESFASDAVIFAKASAARGDLHKHDDRTLAKNSWRRWPHRA